MTKPRRDKMNPDVSEPHHNWSRCVQRAFLMGADPLTHFQFERIGYFNMDPDATAEKPVFNLTTPLRGK